MNEGIVGEADFGSTKLGELDGKIVFHSGPADLAGSDLEVHKKAPSGRAALAEVEQDVSTVKKCGASKGGVEREANHGQPRHVYSSAKRGCRLVKASNRYTTNGLESEIGYTRRCARCAYGTLERRLHRASTHYERCLFSVRRNWYTYIMERLLLETCLNGSRRPSLISQKTTFRQPHSFLVELNALPNLP